MAKKNIIKIKADDREPNHIFQYALLDDGMLLERTRLLVGDYICGEVCIERKEINDFCSSIIDNRIITQVEKMNQYFKHNYLIIVGHINDRTSEINEHCILGKISSLLIKYKIPVLMVDDEFQFLYLIKSIFTKHQNLSKQN